MRPCNSTYHVPSNSKSVVAPIPVRPLIPGRVLAAPENLVCDRLRLLGKHLVDLARVDEQRRLGLRCVFLGSPKKKDPVVSATAEG